MLKLCDNLLGNPTYTPTTYTKEEILEIMNLFCVRFAFQPVMKNLIFRHCTGYLYCTSGAINSVIVLSLQIAPRKTLFKKDLFYERSRPGFLLPTPREKELRCFTHRNAHCLSQTTSTKHYKYDSNPKLDGVSFR
jgi:hypothetical protein